MKKTASIAIILVLLASATMAATPVKAAKPADYIPIDIAKAPAYEIQVEGTIEPRNHHSYWAVEDLAYWLIADFYQGAYKVRPFELRAIGVNAEIWVQLNLGWPAGDIRAYPTILDEQIDYLLNEFDTNIYSTTTTYFGTPTFHDGSSAYLPGLLGLPSDYYEEEGGRNVILVSNIQDDNYYDSTYPYYTVGFYSPSFETYFDRNIISIDCYAWEKRIGPEGTEWIPGTTVNRPFVYESTIAHEYQHLLHDDWNPIDDLFMNEGCSMYAEYLCGYGIEANYFNSYFATPDNSLTVWGDQGDINILADYGVAALWTMYLSDHYGGSDLISYFVQNGVPGIEGINQALTHEGYSTDFYEVFHDWKLANLIRADTGPYSYTSIDLNAPEIIPTRQYYVSGLPWKLGTSFGNTITILGYDTEISEIGPFGTDYIKMDTGFGKPTTVLRNIIFDGDDYDYDYGWSLTSDGWYSGTGDLYKDLLTGTAHVDPADPTLEITTYWDMEDYWDFGFTQISTDGGATWTSLANTYTTSDHDPSAHPDIIANLPGLTGWSKSITTDGWVTMTFDLSTYSGQDVMVGFRYMTDWATYYEGWYIKTATVSGETLELSPVLPEADFQVTLVKFYANTYTTEEISLDTTEYGIGTTNTQKPNYTILVVSPTMTEGFVDYSFKATPTTSSLPNK